MERPLPGGTAFLITVKPLVQVSMTYHPTFAGLEFCQSTRLLTKYWYGFLQRKLLQFGASNGAPQKRKIMILDSAAT